MKCPTCGAENDAANRFCEQCGSRIEPSSAVQPAPDAVATQTTAAGATCPSCGASVLPGEAFCDECGASLSSVAPTPTPTASNDAPTVFAPVASASTATPTGEQTVICPACGQSNLATDHFCDHCGAALDGASAATPAPADALAATSIPIEVPDSAPATEAPAAPDATAPAASDVPAPGADATIGEMQPAIEAPAVPEASDAAPSSTSASSQDAYDAQQKQLREDIDRQQQIITQFEQMQSMFGAAAPAAVTQGLADARDAKAKAEADLAGLQPPQPQVDPAELQRLNDEISRQQQIIMQFEQMQSMFGAAAPAAVTQGLADARDAKAKAEADLAGLQAGTAAAPAASTAPAETPAAPTATSDAPSQAQAQVAAAESALGALGTVPAASAVVPVEPAAPPAPPAPPAARFVTDDGKELVLPADKNEIIVGREDPISGIFPEVDLTSYGGESGGVSRQHARLNNTGGQWTVTDLNSTNYTRVDGTKLEPNTPTPIQAGARVQFGRVSLTFRP